MRVLKTSKTQITLWLFMLAKSNAMYEDEAGVLDFTLTSAGHGQRGVTYAHMTADGSSILTSSSHPFSTLEEDTDSTSSISKWSEYGGNKSSYGCYVSLRNVETGELNWRRDVCTSTNANTATGTSSVRHAVYFPDESDNPGSFYTLDDRGIFRMWNDTTGAWTLERPIYGSLGDADADESVTTTTTPRILGAGPVVRPIIPFNSGDVLSLNDNTFLSAKDILEHAKIEITPSTVNAVPRFFGMVQSPQSTNSVTVLAGYVSTDINTQSSITSIAQMATVEMIYTSFSSSSYTVDTTQSKRLHITPSSDVAKQTLLSSTVHIFSANSHDDESLTYVAGINLERDTVITYSPNNRIGTVRNMSALHPLWRSIQSIVPPSALSSSPTLRIVGKDDRYAVSRYTTTAVPLSRFKPIYLEDSDGNGDETEFDSVLEPCHNVLLTAQHSSGSDGDAYSLSYPSTYTVEEGSPANANFDSILGAIYVQEDKAVRSIPIVDEESGVLTTFLIRDGPVKDMHLLECTDSGIQAMATTVTGKTVMLQISFRKDSDMEDDEGPTSIVIRQNWIAEEALGGISSALFLDESSSSLGSDQPQTSEADILQSLSFQSRLTSQFQQLQSFVSGGFVNDLLSILNFDTDNSSSSDVTYSSKDYTFGLAKVTVLLSNPLSRIIGMETVGPQKGRTSWSLNLNPTADWHKIVHGASNARSSVSGIGTHHPHSHELLVLSHITQANEESNTKFVVEWYCVDGLRGRVHARSAISSSSPVVQVIPIHLPTHGGGAGGGMCRQSAVLLHEDDSITAVPNTPHSRTEIAKVISSSGGMYAHSVDKESGSFRSFQIVPPSSTSSSPEVGNVIPVGESFFDPRLETILGVTYPQRNEVVQSPATILGDDSLLLKYLNPHLCVIVTEATMELMEEMEKSAEETENPGSALYQALSATDATRDERKRKKPLGATKPGEEHPTSATPSTAPMTPTLYVNLVDTVSGQILYRVSHAHASTGVQPTNTHVPVVISENWIIYAFPNARSRRTELGVLTLHEGMIDKNGISAFNSPDQELTFSSLTSPKPVVLTKTFGLTKPVSAIGVTNTRSGISSKNVLLATGVAGQIANIDRRWMDPRRPSGEPKLSEKKEGLMKYDPLLHILSQRTASYSNCIESASSIISSATNLESQSLVLAFGGPDIFFTRIAPSKGFDSLPENFNRPLLMLVVIGLLIGLNVLVHRSKKKIVTMGWA